MTTGQRMYGWARDLYPITRSLTGPGVRETLGYLSGLLPGLVVHSVPSGTQAFDWIVPEEWVLRSARIEDENGQVVVDASTHNLHVVGYSEPVDAWLTLSELQEHLHSLPLQPDAIPYVTSYYERRWGFCMSHRQREALADGRYHVVIDSTLAPGVMNYGELFIPGETEKEVLLSTYICHPSLANNELSGPVVATALAQWLMALPRRRHGYRVLFLPETIGAVVYLSQHLEHLKKSLVAGFVVTCVGDDRGHSLMPSRRGDTCADRVAEHVLTHFAPGFTKYGWLDRGSDERQYCSPGANLPVVSMMRTKYGAYPEYHTSLDDLSVISPEGLEGGFEALRLAIEVIERDRFPLAVSPCEPQLGRRGLYRTLSTPEGDGDGRLLCDLHSHADGEHSVLDIANLVGCPFAVADALFTLLESEGLVRG